MIDDDCRCPRVDRPPPISHIMYSSATSHVFSLLTLQNNGGFPPGAGSLDLWISLDRAGEHETR